MLSTAPWLAPRARSTLVKSTPVVQLISRPPATCIAACVAACSSGEGGGLLQPAIAIENANEQKARGERIMVDSSVVGRCRVTVSAGRRATGAKVEPR